MSNSYFQFKQFRVQQDLCAMKVSTDACIQGAWTPCSPSVRSILDIGTGTGLLALMMEQRNPQAVIDAIEIDTDAVRQAKENVAASVWSERIKVYAGDARQILSGKQYDLIICNPPFFTNALLGKQAARNTARHSLSLSLGELMKILVDCLSPQGYASILLPAVEHELWKDLVNKEGWNISQELHIKPKPGASPNRIISLCSSGRKETKDVQELVIRDGDQQYTAEMVGLLQPFYLNL